MAPLSVVQAQAPEPTEHQRELLSKGAEAAAADKPDEAVAFFDKALADGPFNVIYLNLGRAHFMAGRCVEAAAAFDQVTRVPAVAVPSTAQVESALAKFQADLKTTCPGRTTFACNVPNMTVAIDGGAPAACEGLVVDLKPGEYAVVGRADGAELATSMTVVALGNETVSLHVGTKVVDTTVPAPAAPSNTLAWTSLGVGAGILAAVAVYDLAILQPKLDDYEAAGASGNKAEFDSLRGDLDSGQTLEFVGMGLGAAAIIGGAVLLFTGESDSGASARVLAPWITPSEAGVSWSGAF